MYFDNSNWWSIKAKCKQINIMTPWSKIELAVLTNWARTRGLKNIPQAFEINCFTSWSDIHGIFIEIPWKHVFQGIINTSYRKSRSGWGDRGVGGWRGSSFMPKGREILQHSWTINFFLCQQELCGEPQCLWRLQRPTHQCCKTRYQEIKGYQESE